jgi:hypothetical protein
MAARVLTADVLSATPVKGFRQADASEVTAWGRDNGQRVHDGRGRLALATVRAFNEDALANDTKVQYVVGHNPAEVPQEWTYPTGQGKRTRTYKATTGAIRAWAREAGLAVGERGRLPQAAVTAYGQAHAPKAKAKAPKAE